MTSIQPRRCHPLLHVIVACAFMAAAQTALGQYSQSTELFGIRAEGSRFVYVIDKSGSTAGKPLKAAKTEILKSITALTRIQQFQVLFYNHRTQIYSTGGQARLFWADDANKQSAKKFIARIEAGGGTDHMAALSTALRMAPGVVFFYTDADDPQLTDDDLNRIQRLNGSAVIHVIEFGRGAKSGDTENFLKRLAKQNGGEYRYVNLDSYSE